jgi:required for meiotic nuclear division protein 1
MTDVQSSLVANAVLLGERIDLRGFPPPPGMLSQSPLAWRPQEGGLVVVFRFGAAVFFGIAEAAAVEIAETLRERIVGPSEAPERETAILADTRLDRDTVTGDIIGLIDFADERLLVVADALAKSVALAQDEHQLKGVFDRIEPFARDLSATGGASIRFRTLASLMGDALGAQARIVGGVEVNDKPDVLWERPDLQRLYAMLDDEYELRDRARAVSQKLKVVEECASALVGIADARRAYHLEWAIIILIAFEICLTLLEKAGVI